MRPDTQSWYSDAIPKNTSVTFSDHYLPFAEAKVREARYASTSEVIRAGLRLLEMEEQKLEALRAAIQEGLNSGPAEPFKMDEWLSDMHVKHKS